MYAGEISHLCGNKDHTLIPWEAALTYGTTDLVLQVAEDSAISLLFSKSSSTSEARVLSPYESICRGSGETAPTITYWHPLLIHEVESCICSPELDRILLYPAVVQSRPQHPQSQPGCLSDTIEYGKSRSHATPAGAISSPALSIVPAMETSLNLTGYLITNSLKSDNQRRIGYLTQADMGGSRVARTVHRQAAPDSLQRRQQYEVEVKGDKTVTDQA